MNHGVMYDDSVFTDNEQRNVWNNIINSGNDKKITHENETSKHSHEIHINMDIDVKTDLNRLRVFFAYSFLFYQYPLSLIMLRRTYQSKDSNSQLIVKLPEKEIKIVYVNTNQRTNKNSQILPQKRIRFINKFYKDQEPCLIALFYKVL